MKLLIFTCSLLISLGAFSQKRYITIDSINIWVNTIGLENRKEGQPVIVFESGMGMGMGNWDKVLKGVSDMAPLITYDRPGTGKSVSNNETLTTRGVSERLLKILNHLEIDPPYVLVGHSLGGTYVRSFAVFYPEVLAGLVIIDPGDFTANKANNKFPLLDMGLSQEAVDSISRKSAIEDSINSINNPLYPNNIITDMDLLQLMRKSDFEEIQNSKLPNIPVHILAGGRYDTPPRYRSKEFNDSLLFRAMYKRKVERWIEVIQSVDKGMLLYSGDAGHFVHWDDPELFISSVRIVLQDYELLQMRNEK